MIWWWLAALTPVVLGIAYKVVTVMEWLENPVLFLRGDTGTLALLCGVLLSGVASGFVFQSQRAQRRRQEDVTAVQTRAAEERRQFLE